MFWWWNGTWVSYQVICVIVHIEIEVFNERYNTHFRMLAQLLFVVVGLQVFGRFVRLVDIEVAWWSTNTNTHTRTQTPSVDTYKITRS